MNTTTATMSDSAVETKTVETVVEKKPGVFGRAINFVKEHPVAIVVTVVAVAGAAYYFYTNPDRVADVAETVS